MTAIIHPPEIEVNLAREYRVPQSPPCDVTAVREMCSPHHIWERSQVDPTCWFNSSTGAMRRWKALMAETQGGLREHHLGAGEVWVVRSDAEIPPRVHGIYSNEPAAIAACGGRGDRRVHPWQVLDRPEPDGE